MLKALFASLALFAAVHTTPVVAEEAKMVRTISISGHGEARAVPDLAIISIGVTTQGESARDALDGNTKSMTALMDMLRKSGIEARDIATSNFSVGPRYEYKDNQLPKVVGYDVNNMVTITVRKIEDLGGLLDVAVSSGSNTINGISFSVSKPDAMLDDARKEAVADARRKAEIYAAAGGFNLGNIVSLSEGVAMPQPVGYMTKATRAEAADAVPIAQGEQALTVDVSVTYEIK
jgi:uncharacterized protein